MSWLVPETGNFVPFPGYASLGSLIKKKKNQQLCSQLSLDLLQGEVNLNAPHLRFFFYAMHALLHVVPVHTQFANCSHSAQSQAGTTLRHVFLECACGCLVLLI